MLDPNQPTCFSARLNFLFSSRRVYTDIPKVPSGFGSAATLTAKHDINPRHSDFSTKIPDAGEAASCYIQTPFLVA